MTRHCLEDRACGVTMPKGLLIYCSASASVLTRPTHLCQQNLAVILLNERLAPCLGKCFEVYE